MHHLRVISSSWIITLSSRQRWRHRNKPAVSIPALWNVAWNLFFFNILLIYIASKCVYWPVSFLTVVPKEVCVSVWVCAAETTVNHTPRMCVIHEFMIHSGRFMIQGLKTCPRKHNTLTTGTWNKAINTNQFYMLDRIKHSRLENPISH